MSDARRLFLSACTTVRRPRAGVDFKDLTFASCSGRRISCGRFMSAVELSVRPRPMGTCLEQLRPAAAACHGAARAETGGRLARVPRLDTDVPVVGDRWPGCRHISTLSSRPDSLLAAVRRRSRSGDYLPTDRSLPLLPLHGRGFRLLRGAAEFDRAIVPYFIDNCSRCQWCFSSGG